MLCLRLRRWIILTIDANIPSRVMFLRSAMCAPVPIHPGGQPPVARRAHAGRASGRAPLDLDATDCEQ
jgi:hypothetical protein